MQVGHVERTLPIEDDEIAVVLKLQNIDGQTAMGFQVVGNGKEEASESYPLLRDLAMGLVLMASKASKQLIYIGHKALSDLEDGEQPSADFNNILRASYQDVIAKVTKGTSDIFKTQFKRRTDAENDNG